MARTLRLVSYAINGSGVGHLTRLIAINRWLRRYALHAGVRPEIYFLSSSEADGLLFAERFASFKLPSKTIVAETGIDKTTYLALAKQWVWHSLGLLRPDLLVVDTFPRGAFGELLSALDLCRARAFVYRPMKAEFAARPDFQALLPLYDLIVVPDDPEDARVLVPDAAQARVCHVGPVVVRDRAEALPREEARRRLGVPQDAFCLYVSAGGGGDPGAERHLAAACSALAEEGSLHVVVGAGPLYRGERLFGERITWVTAGGIAELLPAMDLAITAAGYNTFFELMHAGVPALFVPQEKIADEQEVRAQRAVASGAGEVLADLHPQTVRAAVARWRDPRRLEAARAAARELVPQNNARDAAAEMLKLVLPHADVVAAQDAVDDPLLEAATRAGVPLEAFIELAHKLTGREAQSPDGAVMREAVGILQFAQDLGVPVEALPLVIEPLANRLVRARPLERAQALRGALQALRPFEDWAGAAVLVKAFPVDKEASAHALLESLRAFLRELQADGGDLYDGLSRLARREAASGPDDSGAAARPRARGGRR